MAERCLDLRSETPASRAPLLSPEQHHQARFRLKNSHTSRPESTQESIIQAVRIGLDDGRLQRRRHLALDARHPRVLLLGELHVRFQHILRRVLAAHLLHHRDVRQQALHVTVAIVLALQLLVGKEAVLKIPGANSLNYTNL